MQEMSVMYGKGGNMLKNCIIGKITSYWCKKCKCGKCDFVKNCMRPRKDMNRK